MKHYAKKEYHKAAPLFDAALPFYSGSPESQDVYYYYAKTKYGQGEYHSAGYHFRSYYELYPRHNRAEEALFMHAFCLYKESMPYYLDPTPNLNALRDMQLFINAYPESRFVTQGNLVMDELRGRLKRKALENAMLYMKLEDYKAAVTALKTTIDDYPDLDQREEFYFLIIKANFLLAEKSVDSKKEERYRNVLKAYNEFKEEFPYSSFNNEARRYNKLAGERIAKLNTNS